MVDETSTIAPSTSRKRKQASPFVKGSVIRISLKNFLTYDECTVRFNPKLNVIIGPNGTGKSSIVCAICIGLGGKTNFLARAKDLGDYIKHGKERASIEIELSSLPKSDLIRRDISHGAGGKTITTWHINGQTENSKKVDELVSSHNIKLSNLCQFLPQERVADFAKMNKIELLENTELAVCHTQMQEDHKWLKEYRAVEKELEIKQQGDKDFLDKLMQKNDRVEREVKRYQEKNRIVECLKILNQKRSWLVYEEARKEFYTCKEESKVLKQKKLEAQKEVLPLIKQIEESKELLLNLDKDNKKKGDELRGMAANTKTVHTNIAEIDDKVQEKWEEFKERERDDQLRLKKMEQYELQISGWKTELEGLEEGDVHDQMEEIKERIRETVSEISSAEHEQQALQEKRHRTQHQVKVHERKLAELRNMSEKRLEIVRQKSRDCYNATMWLRSNKHIFKATVHEPIMLCIDMKDARHAELVESHVSFRDMLAFVCEDSDDNDKFIREVYTKQGFRVNVIKAPRSYDGSLMRSESYQPRSNLDHYKKWGFTSFLRELFDAPDAVMSYLCKQYKVHEIPVGSAKTRDVVDQVVRNSGLNRFYIPTIPRSTCGSRYQIKKSKYSSSSIVGSSPLREAEFLDTKVDPIELKTVERQIQTLHEELSHDSSRSSALSEVRRRMEKKDNDLRAKMKDLQQHKNKRKNLENKIMIKQKNLKDLGDSPINIGLLKVETEKAVNRIIKQKKDLTVKFISNIKSCVHWSIDKGILQLKYTQCLRRKANAEGKVREANLKNTELIQACERADEAKKEAEVKAKTLYKEAVKLTGESVQHLNPDFARYPDDLAEVDVMRHEMKAKLDCCGLTDPKVFEEYTQRKKEIEQFQKMVDKTEHSIATRREDMLAIKTRWLKPLNKLVSKINSHFAKFFQHMGCAGEVDLHADNPDDFDKYGIRIRVKFRASSTLQELDPFRQSGGERSVSTMLYLVALQSLHRCPFRLVDEINQGMDPHNERRVFDVIVKSSSEEIFSQYFLITPKLLPNLTYNRHMSVHCVYNGPDLMSPNHWKISRFVRRRRALKYEDDEDDATTSAR